MTLKEMKCFYEKEKKVIKGRLKEFELVYAENDRRILEELCFCIFTANASAKMGFTCIDLIRPVLLTASPEELSRRIKGRYRFWRVRPKYLVHTREYLRSGYGLKMHNLIESFGSDRDALRDFFAKGKDIKGIGYKEASHFLRNIGFKGYAILDKHILNCLFEYGIIKKVEPMNTKQKYAETEEKMKKFAKKIGIDFDELDLLFWSSKTGEVLK